MAIAPIPPYPLPAAADLPANVATWQPDPRRAVLLVHDMQQYFLRPFADGFRRELVGNVARLRRSSGLPVAYTAQPGGMTPAERGLLADFWGPGMRLTPADREIVPPLEPAPGDWVFTKWRYSAFFRSDLLDRMRAAGRDQLVVCGVYAHVGILATLVEAFTNDIQPFLVADAVGDFSAADHRLAVDYAARRCAVVTTTSALLVGAGV
ncbi:phenazine biosynthesis protein PhzD [Dactylosporangium fulvum]|uniref:Isochorismatase family protein n=1 Tax=Dactylosporangium fulvum TaxID=53359 RepID=A0ABY5WCM7_9ACTN|nr:isochorismatase family protein [Dactylosporangium fulvum]UWP87150.1 isochorismatase family protein [Dactylosporangium fulvum]